MIMSLAEAIRQDRLADFISQEEERGIGPTDGAQFLVVVKEALKAPRSEDQTSHSPSGDGSTGK